MPLADGTIDYSKLPLSMRVPMLMYIEHGIRLGSFGMALMQNNLFEAVAHADAENRYRMADIVEWLHQEAPPSCYGSPAVVTEWLRSKSEQRKEAMR